MLRQITRQVGRFRVGNQHDYPLGVWNKISADAGMSLDKFSKPVEINTVHQSSLKGTPRIHLRLGSTT